MQTRLIRRRLLRRLLSAGLAALCVMPLLAAAQSAYPNRPIRFIVPFPPGGGAESTARLVGQKLGEALGQPVVIETRAGAGGNIGTEFVAKAAPDGYTILLSTNGTVIQPHLQKLNWDPLKDLVPVSLIATYPLVIATHPSTPGTTLRELVAHAKANPGKLSYGSSGSGGPLHMGAELFKNTVGIDVLHIPYKGNAPATLAILSGEVNMTFDSLVGPLPNIRAGKLRGLAITGKKRSSVLPEVPTVIETGVANFVYESWNGVAAPAGTPPEIVQRLNAEIVKALRSPELAERLKVQFLDAWPTTPEEFQKVIESDYAKWGKIVRASGAKVD